VRAHRWLQESAEETPGAQRKALDGTCDLGLTNPKPLSRPGNEAKTPPSVVGLIDRHDNPRLQRCQLLRACCKTHALPRDLRYFFALRSPILEAFFFTASVGRPSLAAIWAVGLFGKSFLRRLMSLFDHTPLVSLFFFFAIVRVLSDCMQPRFVAPFTVLYQ
jgi:hypothetical protein